MPVKSPGVGSSLILGMNTLCPVSSPVISSQSRTRSNICLTINLAPLQRPCLMSKFRSKITTAPTFSCNLCGGNPFGVRVCKYSFGKPLSSSCPSVTIVSILLYDFSSPGISLMILLFRSKVVSLVGQRMTFPPVLRCYRQRWNFQKFL